MRESSGRKESLLKEHFRQTRRQLRGLLFKIWGGGFLLVILGCTVAWFYIQPAPPKTIVMATGPNDGAYFRFGTIYADYLRDQGIKLEIRATAGSMENYRLLREDNGIDLAIVQGGVATEESRTDSEIESLASLYFEPVWVFYRGQQPVSDLRDLKNKRIAIGRRNSGTAAIAEILLDENGVEDPDKNLLVHIGGHQAMLQLLSGKVDIAVFVTSASSSIVRRLIESEEVRLLSFERHDAYTRIHPFLTSVVLERGVLDLESDLPSRDIDLIAPAANLVANASLHDALIPLLLRTTHEAHQSKSGLFDPGRLPSTEFVEFPINDSAQRYFDEGPPFLQRYLPFWIASAIDRGKILLLPAITLLLPLFRIAPPLYRWRIRSRIYKWYEILRGIEVDLRASADTSRLQAHAKTLAAMEGELDDLRTVPLSYMEEFYNLRLHVEFVERRVLRALKVREDAGNESVPVSDSNGSQTAVDDVAPPDHDASSGGEDARIIEEETLDNGSAVNKTTSQDQEHACQSPASIDRASASDNDATQFDDSRG